jgi:hypothetical protein
MVGRAVATMVMSRADRKRARHKENMTTRRRNVPISTLMLSIEASSVSAAFSGDLSGDGGDAGNGSASLDIRNTITAEQRLWKTRVSF